MNAYDLAIKLGCSVKKARQIAVATNQKLDRKDENTSRMILHLSRCESLSLREQFVLLERPSLISKLRSYKDEAVWQLAKLGDWKATAAPFEIVDVLGSAATGDRESVAKIVAWLREVVPAHAVCWHWVGVRLLGKVPAERRKSYFTKAWFAFQNCCLHPLFREWCHKGETRYRNPVRIQRPTYDL